jgi:alpha-glucosidase
MLAAVSNGPALRLKINLSSFELSVFRGNQLIHQDYPGRGILFIPGAEVIAVMKSVPPGASYVGCGEKPGSRLLKNGFTSTFLNFDNYSYSTGPCLGEEGPLNPTEPLYCSIPFLIETNPFPQGSFSGAPYAYGIFLDNVAQTFLNIEADDYSTMSGKYYLGALYNELDYYFFAGDTVADVLEQYTHSNRPRFNASSLCIRVSPGSIRLFRSEQASKCRQRLSSSVNPLRRFTHRRRLSGQLSNVHPQRDQVSKLQAIFR